MGFFGGGGDQYPAHDGEASSYLFRDGERRLQGMDQTRTGSNRCGATSSSPKRGHRGPEVRQAVAR
jgi:hypothetical protein